MSGSDAVSFYSMNDELLHIKRLALALWQDFDLWRGRATSSGESNRKGVGRTLRLIDLIASRWRQIEEGSLERFFDKSKANMASSKAFIYLEPIEKDGWILPILSISIDYTDYIPSIRLRLALFLMSENEDGNEVPAAIGYRFEAPESEGEGAHNYYHAQMIYRFDKDGTIPDLPLCPKWVPETQPAFALDAATPYALMVCMLVSLYGPDYFVNKILPASGNAIKPFVESVALLKSPNPPSFIKPKDQEYVQGLTSIKVKVRENKIGAAIRNVDLFIHDDERKAYWNGAEWTETKAPLKTHLSGGEFVVTTPLPALAKGFYTLRAIVHDDTRRINSNSIKIKQQ